MKYNRSSLRLLIQILTATLLLGGTGAAYAQSTAIEPIIASKGVFTVSDGSSLFQFHKGGAFTLNPVSISGQKVEGVWTQIAPTRFTIVGRWSWINGISATNDYRRMKVHISYSGQPAQKSTAIGNVEVYPCYFIVEELVKISKTEFDQAHKK